MSFLYELMGSDNRLQAVELKELLDYLSAEEISSPPIVDRPAFFVGRVWI